MSLDLNSRTGLPPDLRVLLEHYPREVWPEHANLGAVSRFWLQRHDMFRRLGTALQAATAQIREGEMAPAPFRAWFQPRLQFYLSELNAHHMVEDHHYFPLIREADPRLARGFDLLETDHETIHAALLATADAGTALLQAGEEDRDRLRAAADSYAQASDALLAMLARHLGDEEDLIVPLILDRGEAELKLS
ncbi:MAG TPA: hemerythrin domain-containing protein [Afifellaceae bacterium]|nr:hemerythrin domain-containing protein [Afifellaceae bacterium]